MKKFLVQGIIALIIFGAVTSGVHAAQLPEAPSDYNEECNHEKCDNEEIRELWVDFKSECIEEACYEGEVADLSGGGVTGLGGPDDLAYDMMDAFRSRLHRDFSIPDIRPGVAPNFLCDVFGKSSPFGGCEVIPEITIPLP